MKELYKLIKEYKVPLLIAFICTVTLFLFAGGCIYGLTILFHTSALLGWLFGGAGFVTLFLYVFALFYGELTQWKY
jgi:hypothetical protein